MSQPAKKEAAIVQDVLGLLDEMRAERGDNISAAEIRMLFAGLKTEESDGTLEAVQQIADRIKAGKIALSMNPNMVAENLVPDAGEQLEAAVKETEKAANSIMDAAEEVSALAMELEGEQQQRLMDISTRIFEASNFQDVTGQRIRKVSKTLLEIEAIVTELLEQFGDQVEVSGEAAAVLTEEEKLLGGPQLSQDAPTQDDIDKLFEA